MRLFGDWENDLYRVFYNNLKIIQPAIHFLQCMVVWCDVLGGVLSG